MSSVLEQSPAEAISSPEERPYLFSVDDFYRMIDSGIFPREARVGLWNGRVYEKMAKMQPHAVSSSKVNIALARVIPPGWHISHENPITVSQNRAPLPDLFLLRGEPDDYIDRRPTAADVGLVVELADSSPRIDTGVKLAAYASAGIPTYWVINLQDRLVLAYQSPITSEGRFDSMVTVKPGESFPFFLDGVQAGMISASHLLPIR